MTVILIIKSLKIKTEQYGNSSDSGPGDEGRLYIFGISGHTSGNDENNGDIRSEQGNG